MPWRGEKSSRTTGRTIATPLSEGNLFWGGQAQLPRGETLALGALQTCPAPPAHPLKLAGLLPFLGVLGGRLGLKQWILHGLKNHKAG